MNKLKRTFLVIGIEPIAWILAFLWLGLSDPQVTLHYTCCPFATLGLPFCPGCGLGRSISFALHGEFYQSIKCHILGIPAIVMLSFRTVSLISHGIVTLCPGVRNVN